MDKSLGVIFLCLWCALLGFMLCLEVLLVLGNTYRHGQIDAINGKIFYHLEKNEDGSMSWIYKNKEKGN